MTSRSSLGYRGALTARQHWVNELCQAMDGTASEDSPLHSFHVNADIYSEQCLLLCQAHFQELVISQLLHRLVLQVFKGIGIVGFINILGERRDSQHACRAFMKKDPSVYRSRQWFLFNTPSPLCLPVCISFPSRTQWHSFPVPEKQRLLQ